MFSLGFHRSLEIIWNEENSVFFIWFFFFCDFGQSLQYFTSTYILHSICSSLFFHCIRDFSAEIFKKVRPKRRTTKPMSCDNHIMIWNTFNYKDCASCTTYNRERDAKSISRSFKFLQNITVVHESIAGSMETIDVGFEQFGVEYVIAEQQEYSDS